MIESIVRQVASASVLLIASDFDGVLAPITNDHAGATALDLSVETLELLGHLPHTSVAVISGRGLDDLRARLAKLRTGWLAGSHGAEIDGLIPDEIADFERETLEVATAKLELIAATNPGSTLEIKPRAVAFHYRGVADAQVASVVEAVLKLKELFPSLRFRLGSMVVELVIDNITKADALRYVCHRSGATATVFLGDDLTDEHAFEVLGITDASVKVGRGDTRARYRLSDPGEVQELLLEILKSRQEWLTTRNLVPIQDHAALSDQRTIALIAPGARLSWLCLPRIDSPALFADLLGGPAAGYFQITPMDDRSPGIQSYDGHSWIVKTRWPSCVVTDYLDCAGGRAYQRAGRTDLIRVIEGTGKVHICFAPRLDFGRIPTQLLERDGVLSVEGAQDPIVLYSPRSAWKIINEGPHQTAEAEVDLADGPVVLELRYGSSSAKPHVQSEEMRRDMTRNFWSAWSASLKLPTVRPEIVRRSALVLRALCYGPTGAISAAGTTSLPEHLGGVRNWDYRYCWPRDAALSAAALLRLGNTGTAMRLLDWLLGVLERSESPDRLHPIYTVSGNKLGPEAEIGGLSGYGQSRPVRVGNAAALQVQLDVFGPISDLVATLVETGAPISPDHWRVTRAMVEAVEARWREPDHGIWEIRGSKRHHVHSRAMCYHTVDRAMVVHEHMVGKPNSAWLELREQIRADVLTHGYNENAGAFTAFYDSTELDAAALSVGLIGLVGNSDPRYLATIDAIGRHLLRGPVVDRYRYEDGLAGREGGFHLCTSWLIEAYLKSGQVDRARNLFDSLFKLVGPTGILSEQYDPVSSSALGNVPQAYSHIALINSAVFMAELGGGSKLKERQ